MMSPCCSLKARSALRLRAIRVGGIRSRNSSTSSFSALLTERVQGRHVDLIDVGPLLAINLDVDEGFVQIGRQTGVTETFMGHDVAPVTGGIADRKMHRDIADTRLGEGFGLPRPPMDRIVGMLAEIGAAAIGETVFGHSLF